MLEYLSEAKNECVGAMVTLCLWFSHKVRKPSGVLVLYLSTIKKTNSETVQPSLINNGREQTDLRSNYGNDVGMRFLALFAELSGDMIERSCSCTSCCQ